MRAGGKRIPSRIEMTRMVNNWADIRVLLLGGEELIGAKQNRVLNTTILLRKNSETVILVSCTERGGWEYISRTFAESGNMLTLSLRKRNIYSLTRSLEETRTYRGDQSALWNGIPRTYFLSRVVSRYRDALIDTAKAPCPPNRASTSHRRPPQCLNCNQGEKKAKKSLTKI